MKIYFEDGLLRHRINVEFDYNYRIDAKNGVSECRRALNTFLEFRPDCSIYTNSIIALSSKYAWDQINGVPNIFIRHGKDKKFVRIDTLVNQHIDFTDNILQMYLEGEFNKS